MTQGAWSLLRAARTAIREDRLTELFAVVLDGHPEVARRLLERAGLTSDGQVEVSTQVWTGQGTRIDLQLVVSKDGDYIGRLWSEHKTGSDYYPEQLPGYASALAEFPSEKRLITIVDKLDDVPAVQGSWLPLTWRNIATMLAEIGRAEDGPQWRERAVLEDALARQRLLHELLSYLEEEHGTVLDPINHLDIIAIGRANTSSNAIVDLMDLATKLSGLTPDGETWYRNDDWAAYWQQFKRRGGWPDRLEGHAELHARGDDQWADGRVGEPAFGVGAHLPAKYYEPLRDDADWLRAVRADGFSLARLDDGDYTGVYRTMYLSQLISAGPTMDAQATMLSRWVKESIELLEKHDPQIEPVPDPPKRGTRKGKAADSAAGAGKKRAASR